MRETLPTTTPSEAERAVDHLRRHGWSEEELGQKILPYIPRHAPAPPGVGVMLPHPVSRHWLDVELPRMSRDEIRLVVDELEGRGWTPARAAVTVLPHLLPKLPPQDAQAIVGGLRQLGMDEAEIASVARGYGP